MSRPVLTSVAVALFAVLPAVAVPAPVKPATAGKEAEKAKPKPENLFSGLVLRGIGPALTSGRVSDFAVDPSDRSHYVVAVASGGVWQTVNAGTTWTPVFDKEGSYSIGCVALDPRNPHVIWVGTGENNSQRSVGYGDGVYRSRDGGKSWENLGLKGSEHIGKIVIDPRDSNVVYVAAQGPLWGPGGDRGLYKTSDGGATWKAVLTISENTGVNDVVMDPKNPDVLIASSYQRRRHVWTLIDGGPEGAVYKSTDAGATWRKVNTGLPEVDMGRIGLAWSSAAPEVAYAIVEAAQGKSGFFRSTNRGESWERRSDQTTTSPQYYNEIFCDPRDGDRVYLTDTYFMVTDDGGKTFHRVGEHSKHVDNHALWIDPANTSYLLVGCDGGVYESFDRGQTWAFKSNLPVTQFYRVTTDNATPFYGVFGGTQDNTSLAGPSRTVSVQGITNADWITTQGGDGFVGQVDPDDPDIVYAEAQYGALVRFDRRSGERTGIQPQPEKGEPALRFNWDSPLIISPHSHTRLYFAAQRLFRSDDRGDTWKAVSPDLTRQLDRNALEVMGKVWGPDAVAKNASTSFYGNIVALAESPVKEGVLFVGTDDGLLQVSEDGGSTWRRVEKFPGVPDRTYVSAICPSGHDAATVFVAFENHQMGDFKPYLLKSADGGRSWTSVAGDLPGHGSVYAVAQDFVEKDLLFAGTEFGAYFSRDGGGHWVKLEGGMPTIAVRDIAIQKREGDLVLATFGRGFYILDDYSPVRLATPEALVKDAVLFPVRDALEYVQSRPMELKGKAFMGETYFTAPNPPYGAVFTYRLKDGLKTKEELRHDAEKEAAKASKAIRYPSLDELRAEAEESKPNVTLTVRDEAGAVVRRVVGPPDKGFHRVAWNLRYPAPVPIVPERKDRDEDPFFEPPEGPLVKPGTYQVTLTAEVGGVERELAGPERLAVVPLKAAKLPAPDRAALLAFQEKATRLLRAALGAQRAADEVRSRIELVQKALRETPAADKALRDKAGLLRGRLDGLLVALRGDKALRERNENTPIAIVERAQSIVDDGFASSSAPTATQRQAYDIAAADLAAALKDLHALVEVDLAGLEKAMEAAGAPWTPGRIPEWPQP
jgi:photosystem II stability/assembly factor-like uncharacterized protein